MPVFQSTLPVWGATFPEVVFDVGDMISIHAPRVGSDPWMLSELQDSTRDFNPRSPCGERQNPAQLWNRCVYISIHAPRVGSDARFSATPGGGVLISIHAPRVGSDL